MTIPTHQAPSAAPAGSFSGGATPFPRAALRLFLTCWILFVLHFATNTVREVYLALSIGDHWSFRVDDYAGMHPDLFNKPGFGWHIGANPGASMMAAIPYAAAKPVIDRVVDAVNRKRTASGGVPPAYDSPWPMARKFYEEAWRRGYDVKFGLGALVMQAFCMAPLSALAVVALFGLLRRLTGNEAGARWMALLYAFGTPVFLRTGYVSHNLMLGHLAFLGMLPVWYSPGARRVEPWRLAAAGMGAGLALLFDYSGVVLVAMLFIYCFLKQGGTKNWAALLPTALSFGAGAAPPVLLLWFYQWQSFGHPFYPGQHWMPPVEWIDKGYQGFTGPQLDLLRMLLFDYRFGLFVAAPVFLFAVVYPFAARRGKMEIGSIELYSLLAAAAGLVLFFSGVHYTRLQFNTGIRYLAASFPFLFVPAALMILRLPQWARVGVTIVAVLENWPMAMHRDVERGMGVLDPVFTVLLGGFKLPALTAVSRMQAYKEFFPNGPSPLPLFVLTGALIWMIWTVGRERKTA